MKKLTKKLMLSILTVALTFIALGTSTFAWFSMNQEVTVSGMKVSTKVSSNLQIAGSTAGTTTAGEAAFANSLNQVVKGVLEPVSTVNGVNFFYTTNGRANGDSAADDYVAYNPETAATDTTTYGNKFSEDYGVSKADVSAATGTAGSALAYVDYVFELKAINTSTSASKYICLKKLDIVYSGSATDNQKAFRVAMFVQASASVDANGVVTAYEAFPDTAKCILDVTGSTNQTADNAISAASTAPTAISIMATSALTSIEVAQNSTKYFKVTLRLYLEGEDTTCTNAIFLPLVDSWNLESQFTLLDASSTSITEITKYTAKSLELNGAATYLYYDGTNVYKADDMTKINVDTKIATATLTADELSALNTAFGTTFTRE